MIKNNNIKEIVIAGILLIIAFLGLRHITELFSFIGKILGFLSPFLIGGVLAFVVNIPMSKIENSLFKNNKKISKKLKRIISYLITVLIILLVLFLVVFVVVPQLKEAIKSLSRQIPEAYENLKNYFKNTGVNYPFISDWLSEQAINWGEIFSKVWASISKSTFGFVQTGIDAVGKVVSALASFFVGIVVSIYILFQKERLLRQSKKLLYALFPEKAATKTERIIKLTSHTFSTFLTGQCLEAIILGTLFVVTMLILRLPYAFLIGILIAVCSLIPIVGSFLACAVGIILMAMVSPVKMVIFVIMFLVLQQIEGQLIYPHVVGKTIGLPGIFVLFAVIVGGRIFGATSILLCIPTCSLIYTLVGEFVNNRLKRKNISVAADGVTDQVQEE